MGEAWVVHPGAQPQRWCTVAHPVEEELAEDTDLAARLRQAITDAVRRSAQHAAGLAIQVSGGLDSSMVLSLLVSFGRSGEIPSTPEALTYESVAPPWHDDRPHLRSLEDHVGVRAHRLTPRNAAPSLRRSMVVDAMPASSMTLSAAESAGRIARARGVDVVLVGEGGDEVLDGYPRLFGEVARKGQLRRAIHGALRLRGAEAFYRSRTQRLVHFLLRPLFDPILPHRGLSAVRRRRMRPPWAGPTLTRHVGDLAVPAVTTARLGESPAERYDRFLRRLALSQWPLMRAQEEAVGGYTLRAPFFDDDLLRFVATIPPLSLMRGGFSRGLMREAMQGLVPEDVRLRETKGTFYFFTQQTIAAAGGLEAVADLADVRMLSDLGLVDPRAFRAFFDDFRCEASGPSTYVDLWRVLSTEAFLRQRAGVNAAGLS